jgi:DNA-binding XRE family transcriptional regulator
MAKEQHNVYYEDTFYPRFILDLKNALGVVILQSAFIRLRRIQFLLPHIESCLDRGIRLCVYLQAPQEEEAAKEVGICSQLLRLRGAHVNLRDYIHEKLIVIDDHIFWDGSLNMLSQNRSSERMNRWESREKAKDAIRKHKLNTCSQCPPPDFVRCDAAFESHHRKVLGSAIKARREELGISQKELSLKSGIKQATISNFEAGKQDVQLRTLSRIYRQLDLELRSPPSNLLPPIEWLMKKAGD